MKKIIALVLVLVLCLSLAACSPRSIVSNIKNEIKHTVDDIFGGIKSKISSIFNKDDNDDDLIDDGYLIDGDEDGEDSDDDDYSNASLDHPVATLAEFDDEMMSFDFNTDWSAFYESQTDDGGYIYAVWSDESVNSSNYLNYETEYVASSKIVVTAEDSDDYTGKLLSVYAYVPLYDITYMDPADSDGFITLSKSVLKGMISGLTDSEADELYATINLPTADDYEAIVNGDLNPSDIEFGYAYIDDGRYVISAINMSDTIILQLMSLY